MNEVVQKTCSRFTHRCMKIMRMSGTSFAQAQFFTLIATKRSLTLARHLGKW